MAMWLNAGTARSGVGVGEGVKVGNGVSVSGRAVSVALGAVAVSAGRVAVSRVILPIPGAAGAHPAIARMTAQIHKEQTIVFIRPFHRRSATSPPYSSRIFRAAAQN